MFNQTKKAKKRGSGIKTGLIQVTFFAGSNQDDFLQEMLSRFHVRYRKPRESMIFVKEPTAGQSWVETLVETLLRSAKDTLVGTKYKNHPLKCVPSSLRDCQKIIVQYRYSDDLAMCSDMPE